MKIPKKLNKIKRRCITCSHIWHVNILKCVSRHTFCESLVKRCAIPNKNYAHFCDTDIGQCVANLPRKTVLDIKNPSHRGLTRIIYLTFGKYV